MLLCEAYDQEEIQEIFLNSNFCGHYSRAVPFRERPLLARVWYTVCTDFNCIGIGLGYVVKTKLVFLFNFES